MCCKKHELTRKKLVPTVAGMAEPHTPHNQPPVQGESSVAAVVAQVQHALERLPLDEVRESLRHVRAASAILHTALGGSASPHAVEATGHLSAADQHGKNAQSRLAAASESLTAYLTGHASTDTATAATETATRSTGNGGNVPEHPRAAAARQEAAAARDELLPMLGKGNIARYTEKLEGLSDSALAELLRRNIPLADEVMVRRYSGLLWSIANKEHNKRQLRGVDVEDLWIAGVAEFLRSCRQYDPSREAELKTYAGNNAHNIMKVEAARTGHNVRIPDDVQLEIIHTIHRENNYRLTVGRAPMTDEEIAQKFNLPLHAMSPRAGGRRTVADIRRGMLLTTYMGSLDTGYSARAMGADTPYIIDDRQAFLTVDGEQPAALEQEVTQAEMHRLIAEILETIPPREKEWIRLRFGFDGEPLSIRDAALRMHLPKSRGEQLERRILVKLRHPLRRRRLREYGFTGESDHPEWQPGPGEIDWRT